MVWVFIKAYNASELCDEEYHANYLSFADDNDTVPLDAGDEGFISWHDHGNGTCELCFRQGNMLVWMDVTTTYGVNPAWEDDEIHLEISVLIDAQSMKISTLLER